MKRSAIVLLCASLGGCAQAPASTPSEPTAVPARAPALAAAPRRPSELDASAPVAPSPALTPPPVDTGPPPILNPGGPKAVKSERGLVVSVEAEATRAGVRVLENGGNAVDAAVAVAFVLAVTHPSAGNLGGGGFMLVRPSSGPTTAIDFRETAPAKLTREKFDAMIANEGIGPVSVGVPGSVRGLVLAHEKFGKSDFKELIAPAIKLAKKGHNVGPREAQTLTWSWNQLKRDPGSRSEFGDGAKPKQQGSLLVRPGLAKTLERIRDRGAEGFYSGATAQAIVAALEKKGGVLALEDLERYRAKLREPLVFRYRGLDVETMPPPSAGGVALLETLGMLERVAAHRHPPGSVLDLHLFVEASRRAQTDKRFSVVDPDALAPDVFEKRLQGWRNIGEKLAKAPIDPERATPSADVHPLYQDAMRELEHTTHFSVIDADGMAVSCTTTLSGSFGAKIVVPDTGIVLNNAVASFGTAGENLPVAGRRTTSSMAPTLVTRSGQIVLVLGSPGGDTIPSTIAQVLRNVVDHGMTIDRAIDAPRVHHGFVPDEVRYEKARPPSKAVLAALEKRGHRLSKKLLPMGDANNLLISNGVAHGYADPREGGLALAPKRALGK